MCSFKLLWICLNSKPSIQVISGKDQLLENELKICWFSRTTYPHRLCQVVCIGNSFHAMKAHPIVYAFKSRKLVSNWKLDYEVKIDYIVN